jgi:hypothetical protein
MFDELQRSNTNLRTLLSKPEVPVEDLTPTVRAFVARYNRNDCDAVRIQACDVKKALDACWQCSCSHQTSLDLNWHTNRPTRSPVFSVSLSYSMANNNLTGNPQWRRARVKIDADGMISSTADDEQALGPQIADARSPAVLRPHSSTTKQLARSLLGQLRMRDRPTSPLPASPSNSLAIIPLATSIKQIDSLCQFLRGLENKGDSLGFLPVPGGTKRVHLESDPGYHITEEATLVHLLPPNKPPAHLKLGRRKRLEIAVAAAWTTLLLCDTPWLTRAWDKQGLCFFSEDISSAGVPLIGQCISMIQGCGPDPQLTNTAGAELHHKIIRNEATFALGILLIELGLNRSFEECKKSGSVGITAANVVDDYNVANDLIEEVFDEVGDSYGNAVRRCIRFAFPGRDTTNNFSQATFRQYFHNLVVAPIEATLSTAPS